MFKIFKWNIKTSIVITYQDTALEGYVNQDYLWMSSISMFSTLSLMSDFMGYLEFGYSRLESRMESVLRLWRILKNMDYEYACLNLVYELLFEWCSYDHAYYFT